MSVLDMDEMSPDGVDPEEFWQSKLEASNAVIDKFAAGVVTQAASGIIGMAEGVKSLSGELKIFRILEDRIRKGEVQEHHVNTAMLELTAYRKHRRQQTAEARAALNEALAAQSVQPTGKPN